MLWLPSGRPGDLRTSVNRKKPPKGRCGFMTSLGAPAALGAVMAQPLEPKADRNSSGMAEYSGNQSVYAA